MVSSQTPIVKFACTGCGAHYEVPESMGGRRGPCAKCGAEIVVPTRASAEFIKDLDEPAAGTPYFRSPQYVGVDCHVCQTRLYGTPDQVGQELKCPDCGVRTLLRPPPPPSPAKTPAAMEGEQYELVDDNAPREVAPHSAQPTHVPFVCKLCGTLMHAALDQVGRTVKCPDCGRANVVPPAETVRARPSVLTADGDDYEIDAAVEPIVRPPIAVPHRNRMQFEEAAAAAAADMSPAAVKRRSKLDSRGRPILPRQPLVTGVLPFLFSPGVPGWWGLFSVCFGVCGFLIIDAITAAPQGGLVTFSALISFMLGVLPAILLTAIAGTCWISIIAESSEGHDEIQNWNTRYISDWFPSLLYLAAAASASTVPGVLMSIGIGKLVPNGVWSHAALGGATTVIALPLVVLSQLDNDTPWGVISGRIFATLRRCPGSWLLFYIESALLIGGCLAVAAIAALLNVYPLWPMPMYVAAFLLYARLLGRLGWVLAEATAVVE